MNWKLCSWLLHGLVMGGCMTAWLPNAAANTPQSHSQQPNPRMIVYKFPNRGAPRTVAAGSRPNCPKTEKAFQALSPRQTNWGETVESHPTFWLYLPFQSQEIRLVLTDEVTKKIVYETKFQPTQQRGIVQVSLPKSAPALVVDQIYRWQFDLLCDRTSNAVVQTDGIIVRRSPSQPLTNQLQKASPEDRVALYAENGLWYDALKELAILRQKQPQDPGLLNDWKQLLLHPVVQLGDIATEPLIDCCQPITK